MLGEFTAVTNWANSQFQEIHDNIDQAIESIVPSSEYSMFVTQYRLDLLLLSLHHMTHLVGPS